MCALVGGKPGRKQRVSSGCVPDCTRPSSAIPGRASRCEGGMALHHWVMLGGVANLWSGLYQERKGAKLGEGSVTFSLWPMSFFASSLECQSDIRPDTTQDQQHT